MIHNNYATKKAQKIWKIRNYSGVIICNRHVLDFLSANGSSKLSGLTSHICAVCYQHVTLTNPSCRSRLYIVSLWIHRDDS